MEKYRQNLSIQPNRSAVIMGTSLQTLNVLLVEDSLTDAELIADQLQEAGFAPQWQRVDTQEDYLAALNPALDIILADYTLPQFSAVRALHLLKETELDIPFIVVTGTVGEDIVVKCLKEGAADYLLKDRMARLGQAVSSAIDEKRIRAEKHRAEVALRQSEARFRSIVENSPVGIGIMREDAHLYINRVLLNMYGRHHLSEFEALGILSYVAPMYRQETMKTIADGMQTLPIVLETYGQHQSGTLFPIHIEVGVIPFNDGVAYVIFIRDMTEHKRLEEETLKAERWRIALEKEQELADLKDRFLSTVSHQFRTPLAVISMANDLSINAPQDYPWEKRLRLFGNIESQIKIMVELLDDVLTIGKASTGNIAFKPGLVNVETFCDAIIEELQLADRGTHHFNVIKDSALYVVAYLDEKLLRHVLVNLLSNAIKYSPAGKEVRFEVQNERDQIAFRISDQGIGIPEEDQPRLFEPFHRAKNVEKIPGTGLGLSIVKRYIELQGGTIRCESTLGVGTTFIVNLPVMPTDRAASEMGGR